ncbi:hypothetical protein NEFER03_0695 [Nematocida sp. LUAm3]|nr:hypothetical protein NEFER03_0695 [Nematocida sp. LUAm3]KAI5178174.1 hypothetical protein NEFER01_1352 [Nematocida sp. LUAm1]
MEISKRLMEHHRATEEEYKELIKCFNIYAYGYGRKKEILKEIFKDSLVIDFLEDEAIISRELYEFFEVDPIETEVKQTLLDINRRIKEEHLDKILILFNCRKEVIIEYPLRMRCILVQHRELYISYNELIEKRFILRDFSTFIFEKQKKKGNTMRVSDVFNVYDCVGPLSKKVFRLLLKVAAKKVEFSLREIFSKEHKRLLLVSYDAFKEALIGFFDAEILIEKDGVCKINVTKKELADIIDIISKTE